MDGDLIQKVEQKKLPVDYRLFTYPIKLLNRHIIRSKISFLLYNDWRSSRVRSYPRRQRPCQQLQGQDQRKVRSQLRILWCRQGIIPSCCRNQQILSPQCQPWKQGPHCHNLRPSSPHQRGSLSERMQWRPQGTPDRSLKLIWSIIYNYSYQYQSNWLESFSEGLKSKWDKKSEIQKYEILTMRVTKCNWKSWDNLMELDLVLVLIRNYHIHYLYKLSRFSINKSWKSRSSNTKYQCIHPKYSLR